MRKFIGSVIILALSYSGAAAQSMPWQENSNTLGALKIMPSGVLPKDKLDELIQIGDILFSTKFIKADGAGRPRATQAILPTKARNAPQNTFSRTAGLDANSCVSCHNDPKIGGAGDFVTNVFVSEGFTNADFDSINPQFSNERGTNHLFGAGLIELLAREMSADLIAIRKKALAKAKTTKTSIRAELLTKTVSFGFITAHSDGILDLEEIDGIDTDLIVRPFSQKGVMTSLRQFTVNALNHHHGMQADERFGKRWTGSDDFDEDTHQNEITMSDISALVAWQATLPPPTIMKPDNKVWQKAAVNGSLVFDNIGCAQCHRPSLPLSSLKFSDPGPYDVSGTLNKDQVEKSAIYDFQLLDWAKSLPKDQDGNILVPLFGDLKRHKMIDNEVDILGNELLSQRFVDRNIFMTSELWGIASTAPYGHRNDITSLDEIIKAHGGASRKSRDNYIGLSESERSNLIAYLHTLEIKK